MKLTLIALLLTSTTLFAAPKQSSTNKMMPMDMTPEQRVNMATVHENMAACLKSDKAMDACRTEMQSNCKSMMGDDACNMMNQNMMNQNKMMKKRK